MPSSTSSFSRPLPGGPWLRTWLVGVVVALVVLAGLELFWRSRGIETSVVDDEDLWSESRLALHGKGTRTIAVLGDSRALLGISTDTLREEVPGCTVFQLSIPASLPYAVLKDLADDEDFRGIVVCVIHAEGFEESCRGEQLGHVQHYRRNFNLNARLNRRIATVVQDHFVVVSPYVNLGRVVEEFMKTGELPRPQYLITRRDRSRIADYGKSDLEKLRATMRQGAEELLGRKTPDPETWVKEAMELDAPARKIQARGGRVVFVRLPTTEELWERHEKRNPKRLYWDRLARKASATMIHFKDVESLKDFTCPDMSHLDYHDACRFTKALVHELRKRGVIREIASR